MVGVTAVAQSPLLVGTEAKHGKKSGAVSLENIAARVYRRTPAAPDPSTSSGRFRTAALRKRQS